MHRTAIMSKIKIIWFGFVVCFIASYNYVMQEIPTLKVPHLAPSGTRPCIISAPGCVVKDLEKQFTKHLTSYTCCKAKL